jgi:hypothetical protein
LALLVIGLCVMALLIWHTGPRLLVRMLARIGWSFPAVIGIFAVHVSLRAVALWRSVSAESVPFTDVLRVRLSGDAVEMLTFTGPFLAEPAKGWLLTHRGLTTAGAFAAVVIEYLLYTVVSACLAVVALTLLLVRGVLPSAVRPGTAIILALSIAFLAAFAYAAITGIGLIVPILRRSRLFIGAPRAERVARSFAPIEEVVLRFLHVQRRRLAEVFGIEAIAQLLLILEIWVLITALGLSLSWSTPFILEGGVKFVAIVFAFIPGQFGASEGVYVLLAGGVGLPAAAGLTLALVRRMRGLVVAAAGLVVFTRMRHG